MAKTAIGGCVLLLGLGAGFIRAEPPDSELQKLRPGLIAEYRSQSDAPAAIRRNDMKPAFFLENSSIHPRVPAGPFSATWTGRLHIQDIGPIRFGAFVAGELRVVVDGVAVLDGKGESTSSWIDGREKLSREFDYYRVEIQYRSPKSGPARLQLFWEGPGFAREPIPAWRFRHADTDVPPSWNKVEPIERGRTLAVRLGCANCHGSAMPGLKEPPPGPDLSDVSQRLSRDWLLAWLAKPTHVRGDARMPVLFSDDALGQAERWIIAEHLLGGRERETQAPVGDHRAGKLAFHSLGCATCHFVPDIDRAEQRNFDRTPLAGLADRFRASDLSDFLRNPHKRYPDGRMPNLKLSDTEARNVAAYLFLWSKPIGLPKATAASRDDVQAVLNRLNASDAASAAKTLLKQKGCVACHSGLEKAAAPDIAIKNAEAGCMTGKSLPRFALSDSDRHALTAYVKIANLERQPSPFFERQRQLYRAGCVRCHQRDTDAPPAMETIGSTLGGAFLMSVPFQRTPRLTFAHQKYTRSHLQSAVRDGLPTLRSSRYTYRMPAYGEHAATLVRALAEADGELPEATETPDVKVADPTVGSVAGPQLVGSQGYSCISCHVWNDKLLVSADPGAVGPDLTRTSGRIRREWFERFLDNPLRYHPGTPMPTIFERGKPAPLRSLFHGDASKQKEALWSYFAQGKTAPSPKPPPPVPIEAPKAGEPAIVAQIPIHLPDGAVVESICLLTDKNDLLVYDLATFSPLRFYSGGQILHTVQGRVRQFRIGATDAGVDLSATTPLVLVRGNGEEKPTEFGLARYERLNDGFRLTWSAHFKGTALPIIETIRIAPTANGSQLHRDLRFGPLPKGHGVVLRTTKNVRVAVGPQIEEVLQTMTETRITVASVPAVATLSYPLPPSRSAETYESKTIVDDGPIEGSLERPGYRAMAYPRPKTVSGEDRVMPGAVAVDPRNGQVFVTSLKTGELFVLRDPADAKKARFENYARGLFQDALSMHADLDGLYVLHRRNLSLLTDLNRDGFAERVERIAALPHGIADTYDYAYGLARDQYGFVMSYAPYANAKMVGAGSAIRLVNGKPQEIAYGMRNPLGWGVGPDGEVFFTDNQGEWVAANKLCHVVPGRFYGFPNRAQPEHAKKPMGKTMIWVPYNWARSINGVAFDNTGGKFGPFAGQFFMAELMFGGAIIRANVEKINGVYQGACFPFWGKGLLGPVTLAFDPKGPLYVGGITEPGWMSMPDRGALFRIDFTGQVPFEMLSIHVRPKGFRIQFTLPVEPRTAAHPDSYRIEHYRYEYTGAYGSPELDRTNVRVEKVIVAADGKSAELVLPAMIPDRVYRISAPGVRSEKGLPLVHSTGAYTLNEVPRE